MLVPRHEPFSPAEATLATGLFNEPAPVDRRQLSVLSAAGALTRLSTRACWAARQTGSDHRRIHPDSGFWALSLLFRECFLSRCRWCQRDCRCAMLRGSVRRRKQKGRERASERGGRETAGSQAVTLAGRNRLTVRQLARRRVIRQPFGHAQHPGESCAADSLLPPDTAGAVSPLPSHSLRGGIAEADRTQTKWIEISAWSGRRPRARRARKRRGRERFSPLVW